MPYPASYNSTSPTPAYTLFPAHTDCLAARQLDSASIRQSEIKQATQNTQLFPQVPQVPQVPQENQIAIMTRKATHSSNSQQDNKLPGQASFPPPDFSIDDMNTTVDEDVLSVDPTISPPSQKDERTLINRLNLRAKLSAKFEKAAKSLKDRITLQLEHERDTKESSYFFGKVDDFS